MPSDLQHRLAKKKGGVMVTLQNTTDMTIAVLTGSLTKGKTEKANPMPTLIPPVSQSDVGFYAPEGQWSFGAQGISAFKTRLTLLHSAEHANLERLPGESPWSADLQQLWKADVPHIIVTFLLRESASASDTPAPSKAAPGSGKDHASEASAGSGKTRHKKTQREASESKSKKDVSEEEPSGKKKRGGKKGKEHGSSSGNTSTNPETGVSDEPVEAPSVFASAPSGAFGIDAEMGDDSDSDSDQGAFGRHSSAWGRKFVIQQKSDSSEPVSDDINESMRRASMMITVGGTTRTTEPLTPTTAATDEDFFNSLDMVRRNSSRHLSLPPGDRAGKVSLIPPSAQAEFDSAIDKLNQGRISEANTDLHAALSQLTELAFKNNVPIATQWCYYSQLVILLVEMERLEKVNLFAQRALLARFVGLLGLRLDTTAHALICLRLAINRNLEMENFRTAAQLLQSMTSMNALTDLDLANLTKKQELCAQNNYTETHIPTGAVLDQVSGQFLLNGYSYALCYKTLQLIRDPTHHVCRYCDATFAERATPDRKCAFCGSDLELQN